VHHAAKRSATMGCDRRHARLFNYTHAQVNASAFLDRSVHHNKIAPASYLVLFVALLVLYGLGNSTLPLIDRDEPRFAEASREMLQSGDWIIPRVNGEYRFDKPPLIYWCQAGAMRVFGQNDFAVRFPSAVFAAATALLTAAWGRRCGDPRAGWTAALVFGTCLQVFIHGRAAVADMPMVFFFTAACWAGWERIDCPGSLRLWTAFYLAAALGFLAKGPIALLPLITPWLYARQHKRDGQPALWISEGVGLLFMLAIVGVWGIPALLLTHGEFLRVGIGKHVVQRSIEPMESHGAPGIAGYLLFVPFYLVTILVSFAPWSVCLPGVLRKAASARPAIDRYLLLMAALVFLVFTLIQTKLPHYVLPAFPLLALLFGRYLSPRFPVSRVTGLSAAVYVLIATAGFAVIEPAFPSKMIVQRLRPYLRPDTRTGSVGYDEQSLVWYLRSVTKPFHQRLRCEDAASFLAGPGPAVCIFSAAELSGMPLEARWRTVSYNGVNFARWKTQPASFLRWRLKLPLPQRVSLVAIVNDR
jgi:4-amino-4-deoxy-L-arabinose transferase-like glycosyltransferase